MLAKLGERFGPGAYLLTPRIAVGGKSGTTHGSPFSYDTHIPALLYGTGFKAGRYADEFFITDIVPTLCAALRMNEPAGSIGKPLVKLLTDEGPAGQCDGRPPHATSKNELRNKDGPVRFGAPWFPQ